MISICAEYTRFGSQHQYYYLLISLHYDSQFLDVFGHTTS